MDQAYLSILRTRYLKSLEPPEKAGPQKDHEETQSVDDGKDSQISELKEKLDMLIKLKEEQTLDKNKRKDIIMNRRTNGDPSARAQKMREAKENKKKEERERLMEAIEGKEPEEVKKIISTDKKKISLLKKIISDV